jgi:hypothetical protein
MEGNDYILAHLELPLDLGGSPVRRSVTARRQRRLGLFSRRRSDKSMSAQQSGRRASGG